MCVKIAVLSATLAVALGVASNVTADVILAKYDFSGQSGSQSATPVTLEDSHVTATSILRGAGISPSTYANSMCSTSTNWPLGSAVPANDDHYYEFSLSPDRGYKMPISAIRYQTGSLNFGPGSYQLRDSLDNFSSGFTQATGANTSITDDTSLVDLTSTITFRFYGFNSSSISGAAFFLANNSSAGGLVMEGSISPVPEPSAYFLVLTGILAMLGYLRIRKP